MSCPSHLPSTPDGRYFVHRGILWRCSNPALTEERRQQLTNELMDARRAVGAAKRANVDIAKRALGERGDPWWTDGAEDVNRHAPKNTPYAEWWAALPAEERAAGE